MLLHRTSLYWPSTWILWFCLAMPAQAEFVGAIAGGVQSTIEQRSEGVPKGLFHVAPELPEVLWVDLAGGAMHVLEQSRPGWFKEREVILMSIVEA